MGLRVISIKITGDLEEEDVARECVERRGSKQKAFRDEGDSFIKGGGSTELGELETQGGGQSPRSHRG